MWPRNKHKGNSNCSFIIREGEVCWERVDFRSTVSSFKYFFLSWKVVQVIAHELGVPVELVQIQSTNTLTNANGSVTGGSMTSELVCYVILNNTNSIF